MLDKLPTILTLAVLVGIFLALRKHSPSARTRLWAYAWVLIFVHFLIQIFETHTGALEQVIESIDLGALELSGIVFAISMSRAVESRFRRSLFLYVFVPPIAFHAAAATFGWHLNGVLAVCIAAITVAATTFTFMDEGMDSNFSRVLGAAIAVTGAFAVYEQARGNSDFATISILTLAFGVCGPLFWKRVQRWSPGVVAVAGGFLAWGAVFPAATLTFHFFPKLAVNPELWNVPKFFVAIGMVLTALEDQSLVVEQSRARERSENLLLHRLSHISSRLIAGRDPASLCSEIVDGITTASTFRSAALFFAGEDGVLKLAGASGISNEAREQLAERARKTDWEGFEKLQASLLKMSHRSVVFRPEDLAQLRRTTVEHVPEGCVVLIPMDASRGWRVGGFWLATPMSADELDVSELAKLEMLATDLGVTMENTRLQRQLRRSEKLASLGQLVGGVAHELNNPLTGILGYSELLANEVGEDSTRSRVDRIGQEARRMHRIVSGLLRFARQNSSGLIGADLAGSIRDVVQLREYHVRKLGIDMDLKLDSSLPPLAIGEDDLKQVLLNVVNNAIDAVEQSKLRAIRISAIRHQDHVAIRVSDTGPGFHDVNRAFDPFYTTKPVGKGSGLGLSVCYGIVKECGGEMALSNRQSGGACVAIEVPAVTVAAAAPAESVAALA